MQEWPTSSALRRGASPHRKHVRAADRRQHRRRHDYRICEVLRYYRPAFFNDIDVGPAPLDGAGERPCWGEGANGCWGERIPSYFAWPSDQGSWEAQRDVDLGPLNGAIGRFDLGEIARRRRVRGLIKWGGSFPEQGRRQAAYLVSDPVAGDYGLSLMIGVGRGNGDGSGESDRR